MNMPLDNKSPDNQALINVALHDFINEVLQAKAPSSPMNPVTFWQDFHQLAADFTLSKRQAIEYRSHSDELVLSATNVDEEIASLAGPQVVAPIKSANFALNAANARWGSLFETLRGADAASYGKNLLDEVFPLNQGSHHDVASYMVYYQHLLAVFSDGRSCGLANPSQFVALSGHKSDPSSIVLKNNGLHIDIEINRQGVNGSQDLAGIEDIQVEAALTTVLDFEQPQLAGYRHWLGLIQGNLSGQGNRVNHDKMFTSKHGENYRLHGRALLLARFAARQQSSELMQDKQGNKVPQDIIDTVMMALIGSLDVQRTPGNLTRNSRHGSIYMVKPRNHGPAEVFNTCRLFAAVEKMLDLPANTIKLAIMDEDRHSSGNLKECIRIGKDRVVFIHTDSDTARAPSPCAAVLHALRFHRRGKALAPTLAEQPVAKPATPVMPRSEAIRGQVTEGV